MGAAFFMEWIEWQQKANSAYKKGSYTVKNMIQDWGFPTDLDPKEVNLLFRKGKVGKKNQKSRSASKKVNAKTRKRADQITLPVHKQDPVNKRELRRLREQRAAANRQFGRGTHHLDHRYPQQGLNQKTSGQGPILRGRTIRGIEAEIGHPVGNHYENLELVTAEENQRRNESYLKKHPPTRILNPPDRINLKNFPTVARYMRQARSMSGNLLFLAPDIIEIIDSKTNGAVSDGMQTGLDYVLDNVQEILQNRLENGKKAVNSLVTAYANLFQQQSNTNYGQY